LRKSHHILSLLVSLCLTEPAGYEKRSTNLRPSRIRQIAQQRADPGALRKGHVIEI
jgi:hypothetical protein